MRLLATTFELATFLFVASVGVPSPVEVPALSQSEVRALVERVGEVYTKASLNCSFELDYQPPTRGDFAPSMRVVLDRSDTLWRIDLRAGRNFLYILGEELTWEYHPDQHEYLEKSLMHERAQNARELAKIWFTRGADRFRALPHLDARFSFRQWQTLSNKSGEFRCAVLQVDPGQGGIWRERLWVDPNTALVWKLVADLPNGMTSIKWDKMQIGQPTDPSLFVFAPPRGAVLRQRFSVYHGH